MSAARGPEDPVNVADPVTVVTGEELRRRNVKTIADALQDMVGIDTGNGSDNGARLASIGLWGLKEFDALLVMVDGVPVGGPFNLSLSQINMEDIETLHVQQQEVGTPAPDIADDSRTDSAVSGGISVMYRAASPPS